MESKNRIKHSIYGFENYDYTGDGRFDIRIKGMDKKVNIRKIRRKMDKLLKDEIKGL